MTTLQDLLWQQASQIGICTPSLAALASHSDSLFFLPRTASPPQPWATTTPPKMHLCCSAMLSSKSSSSALTQPSLTSTSYVASPSIRVLVGEPNACMQKFFVHQSLISARSGFFAKALRGDWKEAQEREVSLPDDEAETFRLYLQLLYVGAPIWPSAGTKLIQYRPIAWRRSN